MPAFEVGQRIDLEAMAVSFKLIRSRWGPRTLVDYRTADEDGTRFHWWAKGDLTAEPDLVNGTPVHLTATVKAVSPFSVVTTLTRVTRGDLGAFRDATIHECPHCGAGVGEWCRGALPRTH